MQDKIYYRGRLYHGAKRDVHRIVMEEHLGRTLTRHEVVHHINGDIHDNRLENLQLMTLSEHGRMHRIGQKASDETRKRSSVAASKQDPWAKSKLTREQVAQAIKEIENGASIRKVASWYDISHSNLLRSIKRLEQEAHT